MFSAFNPSEWSSGQPTLRHPGNSWGFGALLKGLTSVVDTSCQSRDSNPQPRVTSGFKSNALSIRARLPCFASPSPIQRAVGRSQGLGASAPQPVGASGQLEKEQSLPCAENLFSRWGVRLCAYDGTPHIGTCL